MSAKDQIIIPIESPRKMTTDPHDVIPPKTDETSGSSVDILDELKKSKSEKFSNSNEAQIKTSLKTQEVPLLLRDHKNFKKYFKPRVLSLGPIHHGKDQYRFGEELKLRLAKKFVTESGMSAESFCDMIAKEIKQLKKCFDEKVIDHYDNVTLAWMLFVDVCVRHYNSFTVQIKRNSRN
ncbi:hypothetical protein F2P56_006141 [Juglans regia]|uniref:Uncharacterized protein n=1 Tax=Juglans regia TaxID=51240 RepID=A0A833XZG8_JUGRE|nr:hypothetical protein F2P56_006141 [Juglans regia]